MRRLIFLLLVMSATMLHAQEPSPERFSVSSHEKGTDRYWLIRHPGTDSIAPQRIVVFLHGWGATNPGAYGGWIAHLLGTPDEGGDRLVIFPKFQSGLWPPRGERFTRRTRACLETVMAELGKRYPTATTEVTLIGHSIGSVIAANLADRQAELRHFRINGLLLSTPGHKLFACGRQASYRRIDPDLPVLLLTAENDGASGEKFAEHFTGNSPQLMRRVHLQQRADVTGPTKIDAKHRTPVNPLPELYQDNWNVINWGAKWLCTTNRADEACYFRLSDALLDCAENDRCDGLDTTDPATLTMGSHADGTPVQPLVVR